MKIIIDIPDGCYEELTTARFPIQDAYRLVSWIKNGKPLPKNHGKLIDADELIKQAWDVDDSKMGWIYVVEVGDIENAPTIIDRQGGGT